MERVRMNSSQPLVRLHAYEPPILTADEFEQLEREVTALAIADSDSIIPRGTR